MICAFDIETTGTIPDYHEIIEVALIPLHDDFRPNTDLELFHVRIKAEHPELADPHALATHGLDITEGISRQRAKEEFLDWHRNTCDSVKILAVGHGLDFDFRFLEQMIKDYDLYFANMKRDTMRTATAMRDATGGLQFGPYMDKNGKWHSGISLEAVAHELGVDFEWGNPHGAIADAAVAAECWKIMTELISNSILIG